MASLRNRSAFFLFIATTLNILFCAFDVAADTPEWTVTRIGLYDPEHIFSGYSVNSSVSYLNSTGEAAGYSQRYINGGQGQDAWVYNGSSTVQVGLIGADYTYTNGNRSSTLLGFNNAGQAAGQSKLKTFGEASWVYNGSDTVRVGLYGSNNTRYDGYQLSNLQYFNALGQAAGTSAAYDPIATSNYVRGDLAWFFDGANTVQIGLTDAAHTFTAATGIPGAQFSLVHALNNAGQVAGTSRRSGTQRDAWIYSNGVTTQIGLPDKAGDRNDNLVSAMNNAGTVIGNNLHWDGQDAWLYNGSTTTRVGLTGAGFTSNSGGQYSEVTKLNESNTAVGHSKLYNGSTANGFATWTYDGNQSTRIGLTEAAHTRADGYQLSQVSYLSSEGSYVAGNSNRYNDGAQVGQDSWLYNGNTTVQVGLTGEGFMRADGLQQSHVFGLNNQGQAIGTSWMRSSDGAMSSQAAWFYDGGETLRIGLTDTMHTRGDGLQVSGVLFLNEQGQVAGGSRRFNGVDPEIYYDDWGNSYDSTPDFGSSAWLYDGASGQIFDMTLSVREDGYAKSEITYLGTDGVVLGNYELFSNDGSSLGYRPFYFSIPDGLWDLDLLVSGLDPEGFSNLRTALKSNDVLNIVGQGDYSGMRGNSVYLLSPVPLPGAAWFMASGLVGLAGMAWRKQTLR